MSPTVLVVGNNPTLVGVLDLLLLGQANVTWARNPDDYEGHNVVAVVLAEPRGDSELKQLSVHPYLSDAPVLMVGRAQPTRRGDISTIDTCHPRAVDELTERVSLLLAKARHPSSGASSSNATSAA